MSRVIKNLQFVHELVGLVAFSVEAVKMFLATF